MKINSFSGANFLFVGLILFLVGLLMIRHQVRVVGFFSQILPDVQAIEISGVVVQFIGQILVIFGVIRLVSNKFFITIQTERQALMSGFTQTMQRIDRIDRLISAQIPTTRIELPTASSTANSAEQKSNKHVSVQIATNHRTEAFHFGRKITELFPCDREARILHNNAQVTFSIILLVMLPMVPSK